ncbi:MULTISPECIES: hypothetical protein [unclassified Prochlorococcus]|nr:MULTISPECIES: hypothetical protein [unclassified Prochlorococcus]KGG26688.1 hypothetical protein EV12_1778 [Prochlorococcus sp. MIT 0701]KGG30244.1 hypothetical protein EV13_0576 [Prochlorococcus sp. MIT 0702]KGG34936.1 hypothetical protein EV14_0980 [Prochlorococcus sp. MIT 0703]
MASKRGQISTAAFEVVVLGQILAAVLMLLGFGIIGMSRAW